MLLLTVADEGPLSIVFILFIAKATETPTVRKPIYQSMTPGHVYQDSQCLQKAVNVTSI